MVKQEENVSHLQPFHQKKGPILPDLPQTTTVKVKAQVHAMYILLLFKKIFQSKLTVQDNLDSRDALSHKDDLIIHLQ